MNLQTDISSLSRVGLVTGKKLDKLGVHTIADLLYYLPFRHEDYATPTAIKDLEIGRTFNVVGQVELIQNKKSPRRRLNITEALITDGTDTLSVIWFNQPFIAKSIRVGDRISLAGKVEASYSGLSMISPAYEKLIGAAKGINTQGIIPVYHLTEGITQKQVRHLISQVIDRAEQLPDWLPQSIRSNQKLLELPSAIRHIHFPKDHGSFAEAKRRLSFDELFLLQLQSQIVRSQISMHRAQPIKFSEPATKDFVASLPFRLTDAQRKSAWEILQDMGRDTPMTRLLEGDVGSGKTVVASLALYNTALDNKQSVLMVPTEILASQHYDSLTRLFSRYPEIKIALFTRSDKRCNFDVAGANNGKLPKSGWGKMLSSAHIVIGTQALIQEHVTFDNLALVIVDEQHRFGVSQRAKLLAKRTGDVPHLLSMTATPIPRSLALALYGDLDLSIINQMPADRKAVKTELIPESRRSDAYRLIKDELRGGRQAFIICPLIDEDDESGSKSVKVEFEKLSASTFAGLPMGMLHGRMKSAEKERIMASFKENQTKILVATSVIEVGIDIPNATIMMIEGAENFGLAQLHQFRGRVGRGEHQSHCLLMSDCGSPKTKERLGAMTAFSDGFSLAQEDLRFRGPGEVYGTIQKGFPELKIASLFDYGLMKSAKEEAIKIVAELDKYPSLIGKLKSFDEKAHLE